LRKHAHIDFLHYFYRLSVQQTNGANYPKFSGARQLSRREWHEWWLPDAFLARAA